MPNPASETKLQLGLIARVVFAAFALMVLTGAGRATTGGDILVEYARFYRLAELPKREGRPQVQEYFSYACSDCHRAQAFVQRFEALRGPSITFERTPLASSNMASQLAQYAYTAAKRAGLEAQIHERLFERIHTDPRPFATKDDVRVLFKEAGLLQKVEAHLESGESRALRRRYFEMGEADGITRTPTFVVNGRYVVRWGSDQTPEKFARLLIALTKASPATVARLSKWNIAMEQCTAGESACSAGADRPVQ